MTGAIDGRYRAEGAVSIVQNYQQTRAAIGGDPIAEECKSGPESSLVAAVNRLEITPLILDTVCRTTGMGFAAIARVTDARWMACALRDEIAFGLEPGGELELESTICHEIRQHQNPVVINDVAMDAAYRDHHTPARYGFRSYISFPIVLPNGDFFGTLCAIHPEPLDLDRPEITNTFKLFADLIGFHLGSLAEVSVANEQLAEERATGGMREQFIAVLGHDLRNPLASIQAGVAMLEKQPSAERAAVVFTGLRGSIDRMWSLIDDLLDFARGRLGDGIRVVRRPVEIGPIVSQVVAELVTTHPDRAVDVSLAASDEVFCDPERMSQLVSNLVGNALTHGASDQPVLIDCRTEEGEFRFAVTNGGKAIAEDRRATLFQAFSPTSEASARDGLGLGLFIVSEIAKAHGGALSVRSDDVSTCFAFSMKTEATN